MRRIHVLIILLILVVVGGLYLGKLAEISPGNQTRTKMVIVRRKIEAFYRKKGVLPPDLTTVAGGEENVETRDAWGRQILYQRLDERQVRLLSYGADGSTGGSDRDKDIIVEFSVGKSQTTSAPVD